MHSEIRWIPRGNFQPLRYRPGGIGNWSGHLPFASDLIAAIRPAIFVELGAHYGESYFGFCQAIAEYEVSCQCYAVDTWVGEEQAGAYDESVYQDVHAYNQAHYSSFSYLLRTTFDQALSNFADGSIDLLHIDGLHTHDAVAHDFYNWLPKVRPGGVVLLHDVAARHADFGVWKLWDEIADLGDRFLFTHSWGLGVFRKRSETAASPSDILSSLFHESHPYQRHLKKFYALSALELQNEHQAAAAITQGVGVQIFPVTAAGYSPDICYRKVFPAGGWQKLSIELAAGLGDGALRLDLAQQPCILDVASITLRKAALQEVIWSVVGSGIATLRVEGDMSVFESAPAKEFCRFLCSGNDPQLYLAPFAGENLDQPLLLEIWLRALVDIASLLQLLKAQSLDQRPALEPEPGPDLDSYLRESAECRAALDELRADYHNLLKQHEANTQEKSLLATSYRKSQSDLYVAKTDLSHAKSALEEARDELSQSRERADTSATAVAELVHARNIEALRARDLEASLQKILSSRSWRVTAPLRGFKHRAG